jgi:MFS superfamily sulfate permease-like transporter
VVFLVALPLCLGISMASGAPLLSGLLAGIVGGIVVGIFSGSTLGVSGPAAGLVVIVLGAISALGSFSAFLLAVVISGIIQIILGYMKAGIIGYYFPSSVIKGMLSAIGIIIILKQIPHAFGYDNDFQGDLNFLQPDGRNTFSEIINMFDYLSPGAIIITVVSMAALILWERPFMKRYSFTQFIQGPLIAVVLGIIMNQLFQNVEGFSITRENMVKLPEIGSISAFFDHVSFPDFSQWKNPLIYSTALTLAVVASLETLLCVEATDKLDPRKRVTPTNRELKAQGIGNIFSGLIGGLPVTQVIVRSSANIQSGAKTKLSAILHGVLLVVTLIAIPGILNMIPLASLAAILIMVGYKLAKPSMFREIFKQRKSQYIPFIVTVVGIIFSDLLIGITLGMIVGIFHILYKNYKIPFLIRRENGNPKHIRLELSEDVSFLNKASILKTLKNIPEGSKITIDSSRALHVDQDVLEIMNDFRENAKHRDIELHMINTPVIESKDSSEIIERIDLHTNSPKTNGKIVQQD